MKYKYNGQWLTIPTGGGGSGLPDPSAADKMLISNDSLEWEEIDKEDVGTPTWTGTQAEYDAAESDIADGTIVNITDDDGNMVGARTTEIYSTDEIIIGRWIDGKPLYRKVVPITSNVNAGGGRNTIVHNILDIEEIHINQAESYMANRSTGISYPVSFYLYGQGTQDPITFCCDKTNIYTIATGTWLAQSGWYAIVTLEYTKTTD